MKIIPIKEPEERNIEEMPNGLQKNNIGESL